MKKTWKLLKTLNILLVVIFIFELFSTGTARNLKTVSAATTLNNPKIVSDSSMEAGQKVTWDCVWFGAYPQNEVTDGTIYTALKNATGWDKNNDIVINGKKVCGILTEMSAQMDYVNHIVIGIGINVHNESFPEEIAPVATSLYMETGEHFNRAALIEEVWEQFEHYYAIFMETEDLSGLVKEYDAHLVNRNQIVKVLDQKEPFEGKAMGITPRGELIVDTWESRRLVSAGEVSVRGVYGYV